MRLLLRPDDLLALLLCQAACILATVRFCKKHLRIRRSCSVLFPLCLFCIWMILSVLGETFRIPYILLVLLNHLLFLGTVFLCFHAHGAKKLLTASVLIAVRTLTENFCESFLSCLALLFLHTAWHIRTPCLEGPETVLILCIRTGITVFAILRTAVYFDPELLFRGRAATWHLLLSAPLLGVTAVVDIANWSASNGIFVRTGTGRNLYYDQLFSHGEICVLAALSISAASCFLFGMQKLCLEQQKSSQYHAQITACHMLIGHYRQSERLRHDMKNHIIALSGLLAQEEWEKSRDYLRNLEQNANAGACREVTGNSAVDALLDQKRKLADTHRIRWECEVQVPCDCSIPEFDLCILFGNLLDNALNACQKLSPDRDPFIKLRAEAVKRCFLLKIQNPVEARAKDMVPAGRDHCTDQHGIGFFKDHRTREHSIRLLKDHHTGEYGVRLLKDRYTEEHGIGLLKNRHTEEHGIGLLKNRHTEEHGIGLLNVQDVVCKYNGTWKTEIQDDLFIVTLLLPMAPESPV